MADLRVEEAELRAAVVEARVESVEVDVAEACAEQNRQGGSAAVSLSLCCFIVNKVTNSIGRFPPKPSNVGVAANCFAWFWIVLRKSTLPTLREEYFEGIHSAH